MELVKGEHGESFIWQSVLTLTNLFSKFLLKGYHRRSLAETAMFRFKRFFGNDLRSRTLETQRAESMEKCEALNIMTRLGMPESEFIAA